MRGFELKQKLKYKDGALGTVKEREIVGWLSPEMVLEVVPHPDNENQCIVRTYTDVRDVMHTYAEVLKMVQG